MCRGSSVVEHLPEEQSVDGSIPSPGTIFLIFFFFNIFYILKLQTTFHILIIILWLILYAGITELYKGKKGV